MTRGLVFYINDEMEDGSNIFNINVSASALNTNVTSIDADESDMKNNGSDVDESKPHKTLQEDL